MDLQSRIYQLITDDMGYESELDENIIQKYNAAPPEIRKLIDDIFIHLTGQSFQSVIRYIKYDLN